jgi:DNA-binding NtrC family response regulator
VLDASNGNNAIRLSEEHQETIDVMVTDVVILQLCELAGKLSVIRPGMRVLYMSGYMDDAIVRDGVSNGRASFLEKPFTPDAVARRTKKVLAG